MCSVKIRDLSVDLVDNKEELLKNLEDLSSRYEMIHDIGILPDFHLKNKMEVPSSLTCAVKDHLCFSLSSPEQNCGMTLVKTPLLEKDLTQRNIADFFTEIKRRIPLPPRPSQCIDRYDMQSILQRGAQWGVEKYNLDPSILEYTENHGSVMGNDEDFPMDSIVPDELINIGASIFCHIGDGNHFLELQSVDEIIDKSLCERFAVEPGQIVIMYHCGSGYFGSMLGRYYAHRTKNTLEGHLRLFPKKIRFHLSHFLKDSSVIERVKAYLLWQNFVFLPADSAEGRRAALSIKASTNYAYANRLSVFNEIGLSLQKTIGLSPKEISIFWDHSHNSMYQEYFEGNSVWMHRHNTCRILPCSQFPADSLFSRTGQPTFIPGFNTTSSYMAVAGNSCELALNSIDHGAGKSIDKCIAQGMCKQYSDRNTLIFNYKENDPLFKRHYTDEGILEVVNLLTEKKIIKPIARLRPLAALKG